VTNLGVIMLAHLWQSTLFALAFGCFTLFLRRNGARVRYLLWLGASAKFLIPFVLLTAVGSRIPWPSSLSHGSAPSFLSIAAQKAARITQLANIGGEAAPLNAVSTDATSHGDIILISLMVLWALGTLAVTARWFARWLSVRRALHKSIPSGLAFVVPVRSSSSQLEPAVVGVLHPVLLLPAGMDRRLAVDEMKAVLAHERCHVTWRDNLAAALHMLVEALFWFHPLIWWIGTRIIDERERACDEQVLALGHESRSYAEGILKVCEHYLQSPLASVSGIGGANLGQRIEAIMKNRGIEQLGGGRKGVLALAVSAMIAMPLVVGALTSPGGSAEAAAAEANIPSRRNVSIQLAVPIQVSVGLITHSA
jgi:beta-lactamase regulating signal transducer with metallopeptidase domain